jgi:hypothetical protein
MAPDRPMTRQISRAYCCSISTDPVTGNFTTTHTQVSETCDDYRNMPQFGDIATETRLKRTRLCTDITAGVTTTITETWERQETPIDRGRCHTDGNKYTWLLTHSERSSTRSAEKTWRTLQTSGRAHQASLNVGFKTLKHCTGDSYELRRTELSWD